MWTIIIAVLSSGAATVVISWILNRKYNRAQTREVEAKTEKLYADIYADLLANQRREIDAWKQKHDDLDKEFKAKIEELTGTIDELKKLNRAYKLQLKKKDAN